MKKIKEIRNIEILINIRYTVEDDKLKQSFEFVASNKKFLTYLFDKRYCFQKKIEKLIDEFLLDGFIKRIDDENGIYIYYENQEKPKNTIRKINGLVPPNCGCQYCEIADIVGEFIFCKEKNKHYVKPGISRCPVFKCKDQIIT